MQLMLPMLFVPYCWNPAAFGGVTGTEIGR